MAPDSNYDASIGDFSWANAKPLWVIVILVASLFFLHIIYKISMKIHQRRVQRAEQHELAGLVPESTTCGQEGGATRLQRPSRALLTRRRSSEVSALPRYERFDEGEPCDEDAEVEKRGKYTYVLAEGWPRTR
jgi:hypothetical protein